MSTLPGYIPPFFPNMVAANCAKTSDRTRMYNCIAHAADPGNTKRWWWPEDPKQAFWPAHVPRSRDLAAFEAAFATVGYAPCATRDALEDGVEKVALFVDHLCFVTHAARQLSCCLWTSKLGALEDISHPLYALEGPAAPFGRAYGKVARFLGRTRK